MDRTLDIAMRDVNAVRAQQKLTDWIGAQAVAKDAGATDVRIFEVAKALRLAVSASPDAFTPRGVIELPSFDYTGAAAAVLAFWGL